MSEKSPNLLIVGCGYLGLRIGRFARQSGWKVHATTRSRSQKLAEEGFSPIVMDWNDPRTLERLPCVGHVVIAVSFDPSGPVDRFTSQVGGLSRLLRHLDMTRTDAGLPLADICYISTTGVYHQTGGQWVDESSTTRPTRDGGLAHLRAEACLRRCRGDAPWTILRLAGIYGPNRLPRAADVIAGRPIASPQTGHLNLIHVDDAAAGSMAAFNRQPTTMRNRLYVVADDEPVVREHFYRQIAVQMRAPEPVFLQPDPSTSKSFRSETDKRVWNRNFKRDLMPKLRYPTYREGLQAILGPPAVLRAPSVLAAPSVPGAPSAADV